MPVRILESPIPTGILPLLFFSAANDDPNVVLPLDVMKEYAEEGKIGGVYPYFYATVGTGTTQAEATRMGQEIAQELIEDGVKAVILTST